MNGKSRLRLPGRGREAAAATAAAVAAAAAAAAAAEAAAEAVAEAAAAVEADAVGVALGGALAIALGGGSSSRRTASLSALSVVLSVELDECHVGPAASPTAMKAKQKRIGKNFPFSGRLSNSVSFRLPRCLNIVLPSST